MKKIIWLYGRKIFWGILYLCMLVGVVFLGYMSLQNYGTIENEPMESLEISKLAIEAPTLFTGNRSFFQGEIVKITELATARDGDSTDISTHIRYQTLNGMKLQGFLDTSTPGIYEICVSVCSPITEKETKQNITILIDGRV